MSSPRGPLRSADPTLAGRDRRPRLIVSHVVGLDIADSSTSYLAGWAGTDEQQRKTIEAATDAVHKAATSILADLDAISHVPSS